MELGKEYFGPLWKYIANEEITDVDFDHKEIIRELISRGFSVRLLPNFRNEMYLEVTIPPQGN